MKFVAVHFLDQNLSAVFLSHAKLYVFAEQWEIKELKLLALKQLHKTLKGFNMLPERAKDFVVLLRYVYNNTAEIEDEPMRKMLKLYIAARMEVFAGCAEYEELLWDSRDALSDHLAAVKERG